MPSPLVSRDCKFLTRRLSVGPWYGAADDHGILLAEAVAAILSPSTTQALPSAWQGVYTVERARRWVLERDGESQNLLVVDRFSAESIGLVILYEDSVEHNARRQLRIGYVIKESSWGEGIASELVAGLVNWARSQSLLGSLIGGVESHNAASARVLTKNGFRLTHRDPAGETDTYTLELSS